MKKSVAVLLTAAMLLSLMTGLFTFSITSVAVIDDVPDYGVATSVSAPGGSFSNGTLKLPGGTLTGNVTATSGVLTIDLNGQNTTITGYVRSTEGVVFTGSGSLTFSSPVTETISVDRGDIVFSSSGTITINDTAGGNDTNGGEYGRDCLVYVKYGGKIVFQSGTVNIYAKNRTAAVGGAPHGDLADGTSTLTAVRMLGGTVELRNSDVNSSTWNAAIRAHSFHMIGGTLTVKANYSGSDGAGAIIGIFLQGHGHASDVTTPTMGTFYLGGGTLNLDVSSNHYRPYGIYCLATDRVLFDKPTSSVVTFNAKVVAASGDPTYNAAVIAIEKGASSYATGDAGSRAVQYENSMAFHGGDFNLQSGTNVSFMHVVGGGKVVFYGHNWDNTRPYHLFVRNGYCRNFLTAYNGTVDFYPYGGRIDLTSTSSANMFMATSGSITFHSSDGAIKNDYTPSGLDTSSTRVYFDGYPRPQINGGWMNHGSGSGGTWAGAYYNAEQGRVTVGSSVNITQIYSTMPLLLDLNDKTLGVSHSAYAIQVTPVCHSMGFVDASTDFSWAALKVYSTGSSGGGTVTAASSTSGYSAIHVEHGGVWITQNTVVNVSSNQCGVQVATSSRDGFVQVDGNATLNVGNVSKAGIYLDCTAPSVRVKGSGAIYGTGTISDRAFISLSTELRYAGEAARAYVLLADSGTINVNSTVNKHAILFEQDGAGQTNVLTAELLLAGGTMTLANSGGNGVYMRNITNGTVKITGGTHTIVPTGSGANGIRFEARRTAASVDIANGSAKFLMTGGSLTMNTPSNSMLLYASKSELNISGGSLAITRASEGGNGIYFDSADAPFANKTATMTVSGTADIDISNTGTDGIYMHSANNTFTMSGGTVDIGSVSGKALCIATESSGNATATFSGGTVNLASTLDALYLSTSGASHLTVSGAALTLGSSNSNGIYASGASARIDLTGGSVTVNNMASYYCGVQAVASDVDLNMSGSATLTVSPASLVSNAYGVRLDASASATGTVDVTLAGSASISTSNTGHTALHLYGDRTKLIVKDSARINVTRTGATEGNGIFLDSVNVGFSNKTATLTLSGSGNKITVTNNNAGNGIFLHTATAAMTVQNTAAVTVTQTASADGSALLLSGTSTATFNSSTTGTIALTANTAANQAALNLQTGNGGTIAGTVSGTTLNLNYTSATPANAGSALRICCNGAGTVNGGLTINSGTVTATAATTGGSGNYALSAICLSDGASLTLAGGTLSATANGSYGTALSSVMSGAIHLDGGKFFVNGGTATLTTNGKAKAAVTSQTNTAVASVVEVNGGTLNVNNGSSINGNAFYQDYVASKSNTLTLNFKSGTVNAQTATGYNVFEKAANTTITKNFGSNMQYKETQNSSSGKVYKVNVGSTGTVTTVGGDSVFGSGVSLPKFGIAGVQIRTEDPTGMRFVAVVSEDRLAEFSSGTVSYGILMQDKDGALYDGEMTAADVTNGNLSTGSAKPCKASYVMQYNTGYRYFTAVITNMPSSAYNQNIVARAYIRQVSGSDIIYLYSTENNFGASPSVSGASYSGGGYCVSLANVAKHINTSAVKKLYPEVF